MLAASNRPALGPLTSSASSPGAHHQPHHHHHLPTDLSPRSSNSSLVSSNEESLLNTSLSMPSPDTGMDMNEAELASPRHRSVSVGQGDVSPLQRLQNAFERQSPQFSIFHESDTDQVIRSFGNDMEQRSAGSGNAIGPATKSESGYDQSKKHVTSPGGSPSSTTNGNNYNGSNAAAHTIFQCPLCAIICNSRHDFNEHLVTHSQQHACPKCSFITNIEEELRDHVQEAHGVDDFMEMLSDEEVKTPKTNAQGKLKTFKCKHCEYRAVTKKEFWDHTKTHIREDKMLHCPKCPFITEYKHHLEYHLRNHMGSKPYQCTKCSYSCVNKSMLNSHLKSHSTVYQYRCADCSYATKYCHSLKLHLRKYQHNPAMVLNPDGTPNPLPIIDVYGTRRGPKIKRADPTLEGMTTAVTNDVKNSPHSPARNHNNNNKSGRRGASTPIKRTKTDKPARHMNSSNPKDFSPKPASSPSSFLNSMPNQPMTLTPPLKKTSMLRDDGSSGDSDSDIKMQSNDYPFQKNPRVALPQAPISPDSFAMILQGAAAKSDQHPKDNGNVFPLSSPPQNGYQQFFNAAISQYLMNVMVNGTSGGEIPDFTKSMTNDQARLLSQLQQSRAIYRQFQQLTNTNVGNFEVGHNNNNDNGIPTAPLTPLDLRNPKNGMFHMSAQNHNDEIKKRGRRKGKAMRYEKQCDNDNYDEDMYGDEALDFSNNNNNVFGENKNNRMRNELPTDLSHVSTTLLCKYCDISFPDQELYAIHMNFHSGDADPFLCRSCGKNTRDKVDFFRHLTTDPH